MPKVNKQKARADIYSRGLRIKADNKQGYKLDRSKPADEKDTVVVKKGQEYYSWSFRYGGSYISLTYPKRQQLTQSDFYIQVYDIEDMQEALGSITDIEELESAVDEIKIAIESLRDETQDKFDNMPEGLQAGDTGQLLEERANAAGEWYDEIDAIDVTDYDEPDDEDVATELGILAEWNEEQNSAQEQVSEAKQERAQEWINEKVSEIQGCSISI